MYECVCVCVSAVCVGGAGSVLYSQENCHGDMLLPVSAAVDGRSFRNWGGGGGGGKPKLLKCDWSNWKLPAPEPCPSPSGSVCGDDLRDNPTTSCSFYPWDVSPHINPLFCFSDEYEKQTSAGDPVGPHLFSSVKENETTEQISNWPQPAQPWQACGRKHTRGILLFPSIIMCFLHLLTNGKWWFQVQHICFIFYFFTKDTIRHFLRYRSGNANVWSLFPNLNIFTKFK